MEFKLDFDDVLMVPKRSILNSRNDVDLERKFRFYHSPRELTCIPIMASNMVPIATIEMARELSKHKIITVLHKYYNVEEMAKYISEIGSSYLWLSIGKENEGLDKLIEFYRFTGIMPNIVIDVPNGYMESFVGFCRKVREYFPESIICGGNITTPEMAQELIIHGGIDIIKTQIGPGAACRTRLVTGVGYGTFSAVQECSQVAHGLKSGDKKLGLICSDGGCKYPGDICKVFGGNGDFVMVGTMFAGTDECTNADWIFNEDGTKKEMTWYGMSTHYAQSKHGSIKDYRASEGAVKKIPYKGSVNKIIQEILGGLRSACAYIGSTSIKDMGKCATFVQVSKIHQDFQVGAMEYES
jgi:GMP reductase